MKRFRRRAAAVGTRATPASRSSSRPASRWWRRLDPNEFEIALLNLDPERARRDARRRPHHHLDPRRDARRPLGADADSAAATTRSRCRFADTGVGIPAGHPRARSSSRSSPPSRWIAAPGSASARSTASCSSPSGQPSRCASELGRGTQVRADLLPICRSDPPARDAPRRAPPSVTAQLRPPGTVLLVEDHPDVAAVAAGLCRRNAASAVVPGERFRRSRRSRCWRAGGATSSWCSTTS
ncbi:MAG: hypothetical protein MZV49_08015 [Rhodopseudomonas palustris]|nr:hypothetical protein [Rhodopseudomonas palustris]